MYELEQLWNKNYERGRVNKYPYDSVVSFVFQEFGTDRNKLSKLRALELGFGGGNNLLFLKNLGMSTRGIDAAPAAKDVAEKLLGTSDDHCLTTGDFKDLPYLREEFDLIIDRQSIGHNDEKDIDKILFEAHRTLKKGGKFISVVFGTMTSDLKFGKKRSEYTYDRFSNGNFSNSGMLTVFDEEKIKKTFGKYFHLTKVIRTVAEDLSSECSIEQYEVRMQKQ